MYLFLNRTVLLSPSLFLRAFFVFHPLTLYGAGSGDCTYYVLRKVNLVKQVTQVNEAIHVSLVNKVNLVNQVSQAKEGNQVKQMNWVTHIFGKSIIFCNFAQ